MRGYLIDVENHKCREVELGENRLESYYELIGCDCIDITVRSIEGKPFNIVLDDIGFLNPGFITSAIDRAGDTQLVGNLIVLGVESPSYPEIAGLSDEQVKVVKRNVHELIDLRAGKVHPVLMVDC